MSNTFAHIVLFSYPLVVIILFRRMGREKALIWSILGGYLFLPAATELDLPLLPALNKSFIPVLTAGIMCLLVRPPGPRRAAAGAGAGPAQVSGGGAFVNTCVVILLLVPIGTYLTNSEPLFYGPRYIPGIRPYDVFSSILGTLTGLLPFLLARRYLNTPEAALTLLKALVAAGLVYSLLSLVEIRLSPQLNRWIYGFHAHQFSQQVRGGGYRPTIFIGHGLLVGLFLAMSVMAAITLYRARGADDAPKPRSRARKTSRYGLIALWLFAVFVLAKATGMLMITLLLLPVLFFASPRKQIAVAATIASLVLVYPMLRSIDVVPVDRAYQIALSINEERAGSLKFRFDNEDILLEKASRKPVFGWGGWGRSRVFDERGRDISIVDGAWVSTFGSSGWIGYLAYFGLLCGPLILMGVRRGAVKTSQIVAGLAIMLAANLIDLIPNAGLTPVTMLIAGTLAGLYAAQKSERPTRTARSGARQGEYARRRTV